MSPGERGATGPLADVCLVLEGTYPYTPGGVSTWIADLIHALPDLRFVVAHIGAERGVLPERRYPLPPNVTALVDLHCREPRTDGDDRAALRRAARAARRRHAGASGRSRVLSALRRLLLEEQVDGALLDDLAAGDLTVAELLHGRPSFEMALESCDRLAAEASFLHFFWHFRSMHLPLVRLLTAPPPAAAVYHALCTGYAGALASVWSRKTSRPLLLTEHGIYTRERSMELSRSLWLRGGLGDDPADEVTAAALRRAWGRHFRSLARCAYARASRIISLSEVSRERQIVDGAPPERTLIIPNGVDVSRFGALASSPAFRVAARRPVRVGFVGRVVPIKDVVTFILACDLALREVALDVRIIGPLDEDPAYVSRCRRLAADRGRARAIRFEGPRPIEAIYPEIDVLVLTSFSEGQPLVILEANAAGVPVVASDVGACRELIEGRDDADRRLGPSGIVTRLAAPAETAAAMATLARDPALRRRMGIAGRRRVATFYRREDCFSRYRTLYARREWLESAGASSA
jgi:glycosyltransferase involved in cell wall biosynthesis